MGRVQRKTGWLTVFVAGLGLLACVEPRPDEPSSGSMPVESTSAALEWTGGALGKLRNKAQYPSNYDTKLCLDFEGAPAGAGALAQLYTCEGTDTDGDIRLLSTGDGAYKLQARPNDGGNLCLGFDSFASAQKGKLQDCAAKTVGEFTPSNPFSTDNAGYVQLKLKQNPALCLDTQGAPGTYNDYVQLYACGSTHVDGHWRFVNRTAADACTKTARAYDAFVRKTVALPSPALTPTEQTPLVAFDVQGHRGARSSRPENTLAAFQYALEQGATTLEMDVIESADGVLVVAHDEDLHRHCDFAKGLVGTAPAGHPLITAMTYSTLFDTYDCGHTVNGNFPKQESVCGEKLPRLENVIAFAEEWMSKLDEPKRLSAITYNIELKAKRSSVSWTTPAKTLHDIVVAYGVQLRTTVQTFNADALTAARAYPDWTSSLLSTSWNGGSPAQIYSYQDAVWTAAPGRVADAHTASKRVLPWTPNTTAGVRTLYGLGVDGVITDDPAEMKSFARLCASPASLPRGVPGKLKSKSREGLCLDFSGRPGGVGAQGQSWWCHDTDTDGDITVLEASEDRIKLRTGSSGLYVRIDSSTSVVSSPATLGTTTQGPLDEFTVVPIDTRRDPSSSRTVYFQLRSAATDPGCPGGLVCLGAANGPNSGLDETVGLRCCGTGNHLLWAFCPGL